MIIVRIKIKALPEKRKEILQTLLSMTGAIRQEKGCRGYKIFQDIEDENTFCLVEEWENREDLEGHLRSNGFGVLLGTRVLLEEHQDIQIHTVLLTEDKSIINAVRSKRS